MNDLEPMTYFLGVEVACSKCGIFLTQAKYTKELIDLARLTDSTKVDTPVEVNVKYHKDYGDLILSPMLYWKLVEVSST